MILGRVSDNREAIVQLVLKGSENQLRSVRSVVDTGYTGYLMLPQLLITELAWQCIGTQKGVLGDGSVKNFDVYLGTIIWDGGIQEITVNASESEALIGMSLLDGYKIEIEARSGGEVRLAMM
ncbi:MAG: clan AA aspartic protease [Cyanobacteria bacterium]|nr:clan AA aspartic protease [Cyanobacteriota bacterium]